MHSPLNHISYTLHVATEINMSSNKAKSNKGGAGSVNLELSFKSMREHSNDPFSASVRRSSRHNRLEDPLSMFKTWPLGEVPKGVPRAGLKFIRRNTESKHGTSNRSRVEYDLQEYEHNMWYTHLRTARTTVRLKEIRIG